MTIEGREGTTICDDDSYANQLSSDSPTTKFITSNELKLVHVLSVILLVSLLFVTSIHILLYKHPSEPDLCHSDN